MDWSIIISGLALAGSLVAAYVALRKAPHDEEHIDAQADHIRVQARKLQDERILNLENKMSIMSKRLSEYEDRIKVLEKENAALREWAHELCGQVQWLGGKPVKLEEL